MKEYKVVAVKLDEDVLEVIRMGFNDEKTVKAIIECTEKTLNDMAADGWEPLAPIGLPTIVFFREKPVDELT